MAKRTREKKRRDKNIILFLVEGDCEVFALQNPLTALYDLAHPDYRIIFAQQYCLCREEQSSQDYSEDQIEEELDNSDDGYISEAVYKPGGDITSGFYVTPENIETKIFNRFFKPLMEKERILPGMLLQVIQIVDLDGVYLNDSQIGPYSPIRVGKEKVYYNSGESKIECRNPEAIQERNKHKRENIDFLSQLQSIKMGSKTIPYSVYYFSSNLDHFLHNDANLEKGKTSMAKSFSAFYSSNLPGFIDVFFNDSASANGQTYASSWEAVKKGSKSITRGSNLNLLIEEILNT